MLLTVFQNFPSTEEDIHCAKTELSKKSDSSTENDSNADDDTDDDNIKDYFCDSYHNMNYQLSFQTSYTYLNLLYSSHALSISSPPPKV